jgi:hypothetical protein
MKDLMADGLIHGSIELERQNDHNHAEESA